MNLLHIFIILYKKYFWLNKVIITIINFMFIIIIIKENKIDITCGKSLIYLEK